LRLERIRKIYRKTYTATSNAQTASPKIDINRLYVEGNEGRTGLLKIEVTYKAGITNIA
jgi:hypothetical protein